MLLSRTYRDLLSMLANPGRFSICLILAVFLACGKGLPAQSPKGDKKPSTLGDAETYHEATAWFKKAEALIGTPKENSEEQAELFRKAVQIKPDFLEAHYNLGLIYISQNKLKEAAAEFAEVLKLEPKFDANIYFLLASAYQESGNTALAINALEEGLRRKPKDPKMLRALAYLQLNDKNDVAAVPTLQQLLELDAADVASRVELALLLHKKGDINGAINNYREALRIDSKNFTAHYNLALIYMQQKKNAEAADELEAGLQIRPGNAELLERLGDVYSLERQYDKAAASYKTASEKAPDRGVLFGKLGFSLAHLNRTEEALAALENSARLDPKNPDTFFLLGDLYSELKRNDEAIAAYKCSLEINARQKEVLYNLGTLYAEQNRLNDAIGQLKIAVQLDPDYSAAWSNLALVAERLNLDQQAIEAHEKVIAQGKGRALNYFHLGILYAKEEKTEPAIAAFARAIELEPEKYRAILKEELKKVHSVLDSVRYKEAFTRLLKEP